MTKWGRIIYLNSWHVNDNRLTGISRLARSSIVVSYHPDIETFTDHHFVTGPPHLNLYMMPYKMLDRVQRGSKPWVKQD